MPPEQGPDSRLSPPIRVDWRVAGASTAILIVVFSGFALPLSTPISLARLRTALQPQLIMWGLWLLLVPAVFAVARRAHAVGPVTRRGIAIHVCGGAVLALAHGVLWGVIKWYTNPTAFRDLSKVVTNMVAFLYGGDLLRYLVIVTVYHAIAYRAEARARELSEARLTARLAQARLEALEARLHPHFLFNTLNTITALIRSDPPAAILVVEHLGDLLRNALTAEPGRQVPLADELALLEQYVAIQRARFSDRLRVIVNAAAETLQAYVPQSVLQPLVENAIRHGIAPRESPGTVTIETARRANGMLRLTVRDDGVGFGRGATTSAIPDGKAGTGIGINNTRARLTELYGQRYAFDIAASAPTGTVVTIDLPFHTAPAPRPAELI